LFELLYGLMLKSGNDAAVAVAISVGGSVERFVGMMNDTARSMGLKDTHFTNPNGLDADGHYTTAYELAKITASALENPVFCKIVSTAKIMIPLRESRSASRNIAGDPATTPRLLVNHNRMLKLYDGAIGVKTGYTMSTGRCLVSAAKRGDMTLIAVTLSDPNDWDDHAAMLDYGFAGFVSVQMVKAGQFVSDVPVAGGNASSLRTVAQRGMTVCLPVGTDRSLLRIDLNLPHFVYAPVRAGERLGSVDCYFNNQLIGQTALAAEEDTAAKPPKKGLFGLF